MAGKYTARNREGDHVLKADDPLATRLLKEEHHRFRELFDAVEEAEGEALVPIAQELCLRLAVHMTIEEEILYPALKPVLGDDEINEGIVEHASGKTLAAEIEQLDGTETLYKAKLHVLGEETIHHIDEEDRDMFEDARQAHAAGKIDLDALGETLRARQAELYAQVEKTGELGPTDEADAEEIPTAA
ncbi:hemerythrin domain-containing protein [Sphingomonas jatrophae]|uniref:Hemerythrin HHE cation binding domain-containing protein n=1 Tax=Sphingomonas jatrophae TaxID=1166337 RepID=A0A1I6LM14_9SPHN|nr:hemerythrin domain-containing protein [Sphingomonas jatrophae]SFS04439.1 Hemerythrin HHE cation binding domain-containing protein [Sphingomonas jatrophae]